MSATASSSTTTGLGDEIRLHAGQEPILHREIVFIPATKQATGLTPEATAAWGHVPTHPTTQTTNAAAAHNSGNAGKGIVARSTSSSLPEELCAMSEVTARLEWQTIAGVGRGMANADRTDHINSVAQALAYVPPLAQLLTGSADQFAQELEEFAFCPLTRLGQLIATLQQKTNAAGDLDSSLAVNPVDLLAWVHVVAPDVRRLTDARAPYTLFCTWLRKAAESSARRAGVRGKGSLIAAVKRTSLVHRVFAGTVVRRDQCVDCKARVKSTHHCWTFPAKARVAKKKKSTASTSAATALLDALTEEVSTHSFDIHLHIALLDVLRCELFGCVSLRCMA
jgi:hypothetical protein